MCIYLNILKNLAPFELTQNARILPIYSGIESNFICRWTVIDSLLHFYCLIIFFYCLFRKKEDNLSTNNLFKNIIKSPV
jgi:hypothetical protein